MAETNFQVGEVNIDLTVDAAQPIAFTIEEAQPIEFIFTGSGYAQVVSYLVQSEQTKYWGVGDFIYGINIIGVRFAGPATVYLPSGLPPERFVTVKDEAGSGNVTVQVY